VAEAPADRSRRQLRRDVHAPAAAALPGFLRETQRVRRQLAKTPGLVGYALKANVLRRRFWTVSAWVDEASLRAFVAAEPHRSVMGRLQGKMGATSFKLDHVAGEALPPSWREVSAAVD